MAVQIDAVYHKYEDGRIQSDLLVNGSKTTSMISTDPAVNKFCDVSSSNDFIIMTNCDQSNERTNNTEESSDKEDVISHQTQNFDKDDNCDYSKGTNSITEPSDKVDSTHCNLETCSSPNPSIFEIISLPITRASTMTSISDTKRNKLCCKLLVIVSVCLIIGVFLIPIMIFLVNQTRKGTELDSEFSHERNTSNTEILKVCNVLAALDSDYMHQILYTYEALRTINLPSSQLYCTERVETLFCNALMECSNESCVKEIVCQQVRQEYCTAEWRMLEAHNQTDQLVNCIGYGQTATLDCGDQFGFNGSLCLPLCESFSQFSEDYTKLRYIFFPVCLMVNVIGGIVVLAFSFQKRKKMFSFPQILVPINAVNTAILNTTSIITTVSAGSTLCSDEFLFDAIDNPTIICTIQGCVLFSVLVLYSTLWLLYVFHLALKLFFPLKSAKLSNSGYSRTIYIAEVLIIFLYGTVPSIVSAGLSRYRMITFPPTFCDGYDDQAYLFYTVTVPILVAVCISLVVMILILYKVHMHQGIFRKKQTGYFGKQVCTCQFTVPEVKISFVLFYWLFIAILLWTSTSIRDSRADIFDSNLRRFADCMAGGNRKGHNCFELRQDLEAESYPAVEVTYLILVAFLSFASLPFVIQFETIKQKVRKVRQMCKTKFKRDNNCKFTSRQGSTIKNAAIQIELAPYAHCTNS